GAESVAAQRTAAESVAPAATTAVAQGEPQEPIGAPHEERDGRLSLPGAAGPRRPARYGLTIQIEPRPDDPEIASLVESTVWVNEAHPAYRRAAASRSEGYHLALAVALALAP